MWNPVWDDIYKTKEWGKYPAESVIRFIASFFYKHPDRSSVKILDLGCGTGTNSWYVAREGFTVYAIDGSQTAIQRAQIRFEDENLEGHFYVGDMCSLPFENCFFDAVIDGYAMATNNRESHSCILSEVERILKPNGKFYSIFPAVGTFGYESGETIDKYIKNNLTEGPFAGQGTLYFFDEDEIKKQFERFRIISLEQESRTIDSRQHHVTDWILITEKQ